MPLVHPPSHLQGIQADINPTILIKLCHSHVQQSNKVQYAVKLFAEKTLHDRGLIMFHVFSLQHFWPMEHCKIPCKVLLEKNTESWKSQRAGSVFDLSHTLIFIFNILSTSHTDIKAKTVLNKEGKQQWLFTVLNTGLSPWTNHVNPYQLWQTAASGLPFTKPPTPGE